MSEEWRHEPMLNNCFRCHKYPYETEPSHWHYCNDCVKLCVICLDLKVLWSFNFDFKSDEYKRWKATDCFGFMSREGHKDECASCERAQLDALKIKGTTVTHGEMAVEFPGVSPAQLKLMLDALGKPGTTEPPDNP